MTNTYSENNKKKLHVLQNIIKCNTKKTENEIKQTVLSSISHLINGLDTKTNHCSNYPVEKGHRYFDTHMNTFTHIYVTTLKYMCFYFTTAYVHFNMMSIINSFIIELNHGCLLVV